MTGRTLVIFARSSALALLIVLAVAAYRTHNELVAAAEEARGQWAQVQNVMQRREDLIPALLEVTHEYAAHEENMVELAQRQRAYHVAVRLDDQVRSMLQLEQSLSQLRATAEQHPELAASRIYKRLQHELAGSENRISVERRRYNQAVAQYGTLRRSARGRLVAAMFKHDESLVEYPAP